MKASNLDLNPTERLTLMKIRSSGPKNHITYDELAQILNVSRSKVQRTIRALKDRGLIEVGPSRRNPWRVLTAKGQEALSHGF